MIFGEVFNFFVCQNLEGQLNQYYKLKHIVDFEEAKSTKFYFNKMNFIPMLGEVDDDSGDINTTFSFQGWDAKKIIQPCKETLSELDTSIGSRMVASPVLIKRIDLDPDTTLTNKEECYLDIKHINGEAVEYVSYDNIENKIIVSMLDISLSEENLEGLVNSEHVLSAQIAIDEDSVGIGTKTMLNGIEVKFDTDVVEFFGVIKAIEDIDIDNNQISLTLNAIPTGGDIALFERIMLMSPKNQKMYILPLGTYYDGVDSCKIKPKDVDVVPSINHWNYMMPHNVYTTEPKYGLCPSMKCYFPLNGYIVKFIIYIIRDRIISEVSSGFSIEPYIYG